MKTRHGVYTDIKESDYYMDFDNYLRLYFTSPNNKRKFLTKWNFEQTRISDYISNLYSVTVHLYVLSIIKIYQKTERRGFRIRIEGVEVDCMENIQFSTVIHIKGNSNN